MVTKGQANPEGEARYALILELIGEELERAYRKHGRDQWGSHEFYAILKEEVDELWTDIKADRPLDDLGREAIQVAAMVVRYLETGDRYRGEIPLGRCWCRFNRPHKGPVPVTGGPHWGGEA